MLDHGWAEWFAFLIAVGETLVGIGLVLGAFTGIAAFFGAVMNSVLGLIGIGVMTAWKTSSWWGFDRFLIPIFITSSDTVARFITALRERGSKLNGDGRPSVGMAAPDLV